ncbi:MAG: hypothetical protein WAS51_10295 [Ilumatobacteraceae bacterium]
MDAAPPEPSAYRVAHLRQALLDDPRLREQGVELIAVESRIVARGVVATPQRRVALIAVLAEHAPEYEIVDDLCVSAVEEPHGDPEVL